MNGPSSQLAAWIAAIASAVLDVGLSVVCGGPIVLGICEWVLGATTVFLMLGVGGL